MRTGRPLIGTATREMDALERGGVGVPTCVTSEDDGGEEWDG